VGIVGFSLSRDGFDASNRTTLFLRPGHGRGGAVRIAARYFAKLLIESRLTRLSDQRHLQEHQNTTH
jgi:hypothetical protein